MAYKLTADGKTVVRAAFGLYGDTVYGSLARSDSGGPFGGSESFFNSITKGVPVLSFPDPFVTAAGQLAPFQNVSGLNPQIRTPYTEQWNVALERQIGTVGISITYLGTHGVDLLYARNINQPQPNLGPFPGFLNSKFSAIDWGENGGAEEYNALQVQVNKTLGKNLIFQAGYTYDRDLTDDQESGVLSQPIENQCDRATDWGENTYVPRQRFYIDGVYPLPVGRGQRFLSQPSRWVDGVLGGWRLSAMGLLQSGEFYTPSFSGFDPSHTDNLGGRPDRIPGVSLVPPGGRTITQWFNPAAFAIPGCPDTTPVCPAAQQADVGRFGDAARNGLVGPSLRNLDLAILKDFHIGEHKTLQFRAIAADVFNHPEFEVPAANISSPATVGAFTGTSGLVQQGEGSREIDFMLRFMF
jgi:hypothetical protein